MRKEREILKREVGGGGWGGGRGHPKKPRAEFYSKLVGISLQNNPFEVRFSYVGSCRLYQDSRGPVRE